jgi:MYND finger
MSTGALSPSSAVAPTVGTGIGGEEAKGWCNAVDASSGVRRGMSSKRLPNVTSSSVSRCGRYPSCGERGLFICGRCRSFHYCGSGCQKSHWPFHKLFCKELKQRKEQYESILKESAGNKAPTKTNPNASNKQHIFGSISLISNDGGRGRARGRTRGRGDGGGDGNGAPACTLGSHGTKTASQASPLVERDSKDLTTTPSRPSDDSMTGAGEGAIPQVHVAPLPPITADQWTAIRASWAKAVEQYKRGTNEKAVSYYKVRLENRCTLVPLAHPHEAWK